MRTFSMVFALLLVTAFYSDAFATDNCTWSSATGRVTCNNADGDMGTDFIVGKTGTFVVTACKWTGTEWEFIDSATATTTIQYVRVIGHGTDETIRIVESAEDYSSDDPNCNFKAYWSYVDSEIRGGDGGDILTCGGQDCIVYGGGGGDTIYLSDNYNGVANGESGNDSLYGGEGDDELYGGSGADHLYGDYGADYLDDGGDDCTRDYMWGYSSDTLDGIDSCYGEQYLTFPQTMWNSRCYYCNYTSDCDEVE